jgi:23S rRNA (uridine2552-2'-O)-methyltransferase
MTTIAPKKPTKGQKIINKRLKVSSKDWLRRQLDDPYVRMAQQKGYRARAAFKLLEIDEKFKVLKGRQRVVDLGCAPGSWAQICAKAGMKVVGIDLLPCAPLAGVVFLEMDFTTAEGLAAVLEHFGGKAPDLVLCDMAANTVGHAATDGLRTQQLSELAVDFAIQHGAKGSHFVSKLFMNGYENDAKKVLAPYFERVQLFKPPSSRSESRETFLVALNKLA